MNMGAPVARRNSLLLGALLGILVMAYAYLNTGTLWLVVDIVSADQDQAQLFFSPDGHWNEKQSVTKALSPGLNRLAIRLPTAAWGSSVRFDPGRIAGQYHVLGVSWHRGLLQHEVSFADIRSARPEGLRMLQGSGVLELNSADTDPQLLVPLPGLSWHVASLLLPLGLVCAAVMAMLFAVWRGRLDIIGLASFFAAICVALYSALLWCFGPRLPLFDDWRYVVPGPFNLVEGRLDWVKVVGNDTYFLTGQVFDYLSLNLSNANFGVLRAVAFVLLLLQLWLTYRILRRCANTVSPLLAAPSIAFIAWSLVANNYWGGTAIAYHQFLPVLCGTLMLTYLLGADGTLRSDRSMLLLCVIALASGLAYISGGPLVFALGAALLLAHADMLRQGPWSPKMRAGLLLAVAGIGLLSLQMTLVMRTQGNLLEHNHAVGSVYPNDHRFWLFFTALFGRALGYSGRSAAIDAALTVAALLPAVVLGLERMWFGLVRGRACERRTLTSVALYGGLVAVIYTGIVTFGRAGFIAANASAETVLMVANFRFHYWVIAAMLPFLWLGWAEVASRWPGRLTAGAAVLCALAISAPKSLLPWDVLSTFREQNGIAVRGAHCIASQMADGSAEPIVCQEMTGLPMDLSGTLQRLRNDGRVLYRDIERYSHPPLP